MNEFDLERLVLLEEQKWHDEFWRCIPITCMLIQPGKSPQMIEADNNDESWSSLVGPDYGIHYVVEGLGVVIHDEERYDLEPCVGLYLPREDKEVIVRGSIIISGMTYSDGGIALPTEGEPWLCSLSQYAIEYTLPNYIRSLDDMYGKSWWHG